MKLLDIDTKIPNGPISEKWKNYKATCKLISPNNRNKFTVIVVGTGLSGSAAASSLAEQGYNIKSFCFQDTPRRAHSVAAQGGVNACKNYKNDGDNVFRMFYDTLKGGDFRSREANVYRLAECSASLIDQAVAQGVPFGREYSGYLRNRSFGGVQVSRTFYARGQTGQQLLLGAYQALMRQVAKKRISLHTRQEMLDLVLINNRAKGIITRNLETGELEAHYADAVVLATGGYGKIFYLSTLAMGCNASAIWRVYKKGAFMANPSWTQIHPTSLPQTGTYQSKLTLMSESLRNDGRIWVPKKREDTRKPNDIPTKDRDYYLERRYPAYGNLAPRDIASRAAKERIDAGYGVGKFKNAVYLDFSTAIKEHGKGIIKERYGNLFDMYQKITGINAYKEPMKISPSAHFSMGGLWVDYELMTNIPGLFCIGEANFSDHGANRLGANSLLQACVDGYFILPITLPNYLASILDLEKQNNMHDAFKVAKLEVQQRIEQLMQIKGTKTAEEYHKELGEILTKKCGLVRNEQGLKEAIQEIKEIRIDFYSNLLIPATAQEMNSELEKAGRVADYLELAELMCIDALTRKESCGAHFREEYQTKDGEALRKDEEFSFSSVWKFTGNISKPDLYKEALIFKEVKPVERNYK